MITVLAYSQARNVILPNRPDRHGYKDYSMTDQGLWFATEIEGASSIMQETKNMQFATLSVTAGYRFNEFFRIGAGIGGRAYVNNSDFRKSEHIWAIPIFMNLRGNIICKHDRAGAPYWSVNIGGVTDEGVYFNPVIGYSFGGLRNNFLVGLSYTLNNFKDNQDKNWTYSYLGVKLGYEF